MTDRTMLVNRIIAKLPTLDLQWPDAVQSAWWTAFERIMVTVSNILDTPASDPTAQAQAEEARSDG